MLEAEFMKALINAGIGAFLALLMLVGLYRIASGLGGRFIEAQQRQAEAMGSQAQSIEGLTRSIRDFVTSDRTEHREMLVLLRLLIQRQRAYEEEKD